VCAAAHRDGKVLCPRHGDGGLDVGNTARPGNQRRTFVDERVPHAPRLVVTGVVRRDDVTAMAPTKLLEWVEVRGMSDGVS
jgi:hypothetical protein